MCVFFLSCCCCCLLSNSADSNFFLLSSFFFLSFFLQDTARLARTEEELENVRNRREEAEKDSSKWRSQCDIAESEKRRATLDLEMLTRKYDDIERENERNHINMNTYREEASEQKYETRAKDDQINTLTREVRNLTLDMERDRRDYQVKIEEAQHRIQQLEEEVGQLVINLKTEHSELESKQSIIEKMKVTLTLSETTINSLNDDTEQTRREIESMSLQVRDSHNRIEMAKRSNADLQEELNLSKINIAKLEERGRSFDQRILEDTKRHDTTMEREIEIRVEVEKSLQRSSKENVVLRKRHDMLALERDRAHEGYSALRKQTERLQNAAREAARKAQLAALHVQRQMLGENATTIRLGSTTSTTNNSRSSISRKHGVNSGRVQDSRRGTSGSGSGSGSGGGGDQRRRTKGQAAFDAAEDLSWVALGGGGDVEKKMTEKEEGGGEKESNKNMSVDELNTKGER